MASTLSETASVPPEKIADSFDAAVAERQKTWKTKPKDSAKPAEHPKAPETPDTDDPTEVAQVSEKKAPDADTTSVPVVEEPSDLSFLPEEIRPKVPTLAKEVREWMKKQAEDASYRKRYEDLRSEFTPKTQIRAEVEKKASLWEALQNDPEAAKAAMDAMERRKAGKPSPEEDDGWDFADHTSAENKAYLRKQIANEAKRAAAEESRETLRREVIEPQDRLRKIGSAIESWASEKNIPQETVVKAIEIAKEHANNLGLVWTPENATRLVELGMNLLPTAKATTPVAKVESKGLSRVASPSTRGVGTPAPSVPAWQRDGKKWPRTAEERAAHFYSLDIGDVHPE